MTKKDSIISFGFDRESGDNVSLLTLNNESYLLCPNCFAVYKVRHSGYINAKLTARESDVTGEKFNLEFATKVDYVCTCKDCQKTVTLIQCDTDLVDAARDLNQNGYKIVSCCEGHSNDWVRRMFIMFDRSVVIESVPKGWSYDIDGNTIEVKYIDAEQFSCALSELYSWVSRLVKSGKESTE